MKTEERSRHTVWMEDAVWQRVQEHYKSDGCSTQNEFIAKAILFYCGYLQSEYAGDFLPKILGEMCGGGCQYRLPGMLCQYGEMRRRRAGARACPGA